jgi:predicted TIM-barrel fold metal-dependent hydrolase
VSAYTGPVVDVDVHHHMKSADDVVQYLPKRAREVVTANPRLPFKFAPPSTLGASTLPNMGRRADVQGPGLGFPGSSYEMLRDRLLDPFNYFRAVLTHDVGDYALLFNTEIAAAVCSAANDWTIEHWLARDDRLRGLLVCPLGDPEAAVAEVHRVGSHPQIDGILLCGSPLGHPFGHPCYHQVYAAAVEHGLVLSIHPGTGERMSARTVPEPLMTTAETLAITGQQAATYVASFIVHGVFEKFPALRLIIKEYGVAWIPSVLWRMDQHHDLYRQESSWVKRWPSEYVREHIRFSTQPLEVADDSRLVADFFDSVEGMDEVLVFSSDYPHISSDDVRYVARMLPDDGWRRKVMCENACAAYGWKPPVPDAAAVG